MAYLLGIDGGTESIRAIVFDLDGRPKGSHASAYQTQFPKPVGPSRTWRIGGAASAKQPVERSKLPVFPPIR